MLFGVTTSFLPSTRIAIKYMQVSEGIDFSDDNARVVVSFFVYLLWSLGSLSRANAVGLKFIVIFWCYTFMLSLMVASKEVLALDVSVFCIIVLYMSQWKHSFNEEYAAWWSDLIISWQYVYLR